MTCSARLHGMEIKKPSGSNSSSVKEFSNDEEAAMNAAIAKAKERKAIEHGRK